LRISFIQLTEKCDWFEGAAFEMMEGGVIVVRYRRLYQPLVWFCLALSVVCAAGFYGCARQSVELTGTWFSDEIMHPSPFFAETLSNNRSGSVTVRFDKAGRFEWGARDRVHYTGTYLVDGASLVLTESQGEATYLGYELRLNQLVLHSQDGFMFVFHRAAGDSLPVSQP